MNTKELFAELKSLPKPTPNRDGWSSYETLGLSASDCEALVELAEDYFVNWEQTEEEERVAIHAWRALSMVCGDSELPEVVSFFIDATFDSMEMGEELLAGDLGTIWAHLGFRALSPIMEAIEESGGHGLLLATLTEGIGRMATGEQERQLAIDALLSLLDQDYPDRVDRSFIIAGLIDLEAVECIDRIRDEYAANRVDITMNGDCEAVELELGVRDARETPAPHFAEMEAELAQAERQALAGPFPQEGSLAEKLQYFLVRYGNRTSIARVDELDGFLLGLSLVGQLSNQERSNLLWDTVEGDPGLSPKFESGEEKSEWSRCLREWAKEIDEGLSEATYTPHILPWPDAAESNDPETPYFSPWLSGFLKADVLMGTDEELAGQQHERIMRELALEIVETESKGIRLLEDKTNNPIYEFMSLVYERFEKRLAGPKRSLDRAGMAEDGALFDTKPAGTAKVERNAPCPCGSGLKYKKCCLN